jgi:hypothetical protein
MCTLVYTTQRRQAKNDFREIGGCCQRKVWEAGERAHMGLLGTLVEYHCHICNVKTHVTAPSSRFSDGKKNVQFLGPERRTTDVLSA